MDARTLSDRELLELEIETLWKRNGAGRLLRASLFNDGPAPDLVIAASDGAITVAFGPDIPEALAEEITVRGALATRRGLNLAFPRPPRDGTWPALIDDLLQRLSADLGPVEVASGPSYVCEGVPAGPLAAGLVRSEDVAADFRRLAPPEDANWEPWEWELLLNGKLGSWAAMIAAEEVVSLCFCARLTGTAAEAGLRTEADFRRQGYGVAVTAAWASQVLATGRIAFYSTSADNLASQRVAARLGLRPIGWMWQLSKSRV